jgi:ribosomal peptide maturation radical SAM protein 1
VFHSTTDLQFTGRPSAAARRLSRRRRRMTWVEWIPPGRGRSGPAERHAQPRPTTDRKVLLVLTPWASPYFPGLSVALLRSVLNRAGIACDLFYANLLFSKIVDGDPLYEEQLSKGSYAEMAFTPYYFDSSIDSAVDTLHRHFRPLTADAAPWRRLLQHSGTFLDHCMSAVRWEDYDIVGFSLMFQQTLCSLALARRIKQRYPHITIVFGGPTCAAPMGREFIRSFPEVDYVVMGEADEAIVPIVRSIREQPGTMPVPGVLYRRARPDGGAPEVVETGHPRPVHRMDDLPIPDYTPYFEQVEQHQLTHFDPYLFVENSRGCWWGEKHHCTFCGIDDEFMGFRTKSPDRILDELVTLSRRHKRTSFLTADNILHHRFYTTLLPRIKDLREKAGYDFTMFFELKSNITRSHARLLREAGVVQVQPGIESFSDRILGLMDKGTTGIQQLFALRSFAEFDIAPIWNIIYMNPNERPEDYRGMLDMIPAMHHLPPLPKQGLVQMLLQRYNPYFERPDDHGVRDIRAQGFYRELFPRDDINFQDLAFFFDYDRTALGTPALGAVHRELSQALDTWRAYHVPDSLLQFRGPGFVEIVDRRAWRNGDGGWHAGDTRHYVLHGLPADVLTYCDTIRTEPAIVAEFQDRAGEGEVRAALDELLARRVIYRAEQGRHVSLPLLKSRAARYLGTAREQYQPTDGIAGPLKKGAAPARQRPARWEPPRAQVCTRAGSAEEWVDQLVEEARRHRTVFLDVVGQVLDPPCARALLPALAARQAQEGIGLSLRCAIGPDLTRDEVQLIADAGIGVVRLPMDEAPGDGSERPLLAAVLQRIQLLRLLAEARVDVEWDLNPELPGTSPEEAAAVAGLLESLGHLPPPSRLPPGEGEGPRAHLAAAVDRWHECYGPDTLTYSQGPEFVRILDARRRWRESEAPAGDRLVTLSGAQAAIFQYCTERRTRAQVLARFGREHTIRQLDEFLAMLSRMGYACTADGTCLSLPVHRKIVGIG